MTDGDIYYNIVFGDLWIASGDKLIKINDGYPVDADAIEGFIKVGHANVITPEI